LLFFLLLLDLNSDYDSCSIPLIGGEDDAEEDNYLYGLVIPILDLRFDKNP